MNSYVGYCWYYIYTPLDLINYIIRSFKKIKRTNKQTKNFRQSESHIYWPIIAPERKNARKRTEEAATARKLRTVRIVRSTEEPKEGEREARASNNGRMLLFSFPLCWPSTYIKEWILYTDSDCGVRRRVRFAVRTALLLLPLLLLLTAAATAGESRCDVACLIIQQTPQTLSPLVFLF